MIGLFNESFPPIIDGVCMCVYNYAKYLTKSGEKVLVVTPESSANTRKTEVDRQEDFYIKRYPSIPVPFHRPYRLGIKIFAEPLFLQFKRYNLQLVHAHCPFSSGSLAKRIARKRKIPFVATFHSKYRSDFERVIKNKTIVDLIIKNIVSFYEEADEVWVPQEAVSETLMEYGYRGKKPYIMPNGNDLANRSDREDLRAKMRKKLGLTDKTPLLLFVGQQTREKNLPFILQSLEHLGDMPYRMISIGEGYGLEEFKSLARSLGIGQKVDFPGVVYDRDDLAAYYAASDLFLFPSVYDTWGLVFREAAALGTPSLLLAESLAASGIQDGENGFLSIESTSEYAEKIRSILSDPQKLSEVGNKARETLALSWDNVVQKVQDRYQYLIENHKKVHHDDD